MYNVSKKKKRKIGEHVVATDDQKALSVLVKLCNRYRNNLLHSGAMPWKFPRLSI